LGKITLSLNKRKTENEFKKSIGKIFENTSFSGNVIILKLH